ncbi:hypothetical protein GW935_04810 [Candidatus Falkowbacteria bacterium]|nr:hypothetical protein [Candidatus Falkowbacteria bacterium]
MKRVSWKYLAGLIDGEGCIDVQVTKVNDSFYIRPRLRVNMSNVALELLEMCKLNFGGYLSKRDFPQKETWTSATSWELAGYKQSCPTIRNIVNHLILKKEQARFCLWMESNIKGKHISQECVDRCREELKLMKRDPHRLSESAQDVILGML